MVSDSPRKVKSYNISDDWKDLGIYNEVSVQSADGVISNIKVNGEEYGGGGGESDFSTAEVTLNLAPPEDVTFIETALVNLRTEYPNEDFSYTCLYLPSINNKCPVLLYQGRAIVDGVKGSTADYIDYEFIIGTPITTGGVTWNSQERFFEITGDGTITAVVSNRSQA